MIFIVRSKCLRKEILHIPAKRAPRSTGEHHEGDRPPARQPSAYKIGDRSERLVCEEFRGCSGVRESRTHTRQSSKVSYLTNNIMSFNYIILLSGLCKIWISSGIGTTMWCKLWPRVSSKWRRTRAARWMPPPRAPSSTFSTASTCPASASECWSTSTVCGMVVLKGALLITSNCSPTLWRQSPFWWSSHRLFGPRLRSVGRGARCLWEC